MFTWEDVVKLFVLATIIGGMMSGLMMLYHYLASARKRMMIKQAANKITKEYLPAIVETEVELFNRLTDKMMEKLPDLVKETKKIVDDAMSDYHDKWENG